MKSNEIILDITDKFGEDRKPELTRELKKLRTKVRRELLYRMEYTVKQIKENY
jgi:hypothetical protein